MATNTTWISAWIGAIALVVICTALSATQAALTPFDTPDGQTHHAYAVISATATDPATVDGAITDRRPGGRQAVVFNAAQTRPPSDHTVTDATAKLATFPETTAGLRALAAYAKQVRSDLSAAGDARGLKAFDAVFRERDAAIARAALPGFTAMLAAMPSNRHGLTALDAIPEQYGTAFVALPPDLQQRYAIALATRHDAITAVISQDQARRAAPLAKGTPDPTEDR